jgi:D-serine deaminase-like pyridoxal phosphate-dependent protein
VAFYPGHIKDVRAESAAMELATLDAQLEEAVSDLETAGFPAAVVSGGSTPTLFHSHQLRRLNEIRPGTYIFNDRNTWATGGCSLEDCAASVLVTVVSTSVPGRMIVDGGSKTFSSDRSALAETDGFGYVPECPPAIFERMNEEHGFFDIRQTPKMWSVGDKLRIIPNHICVAVNLHEQIYGVRGEEVETVWKVEGRGKLQ